MEHTPEQKKILNSLAYHWSEADRAVIHFPSSTALRSSQRRTNGEIASIGTFSIISLEIIHNILYELDIERLGIIRCLNKHARDVV
jgi:hypothetical protein